MEKRKAARWYGIKDMRLEEIDIPPIGLNDVLVKVAAVGICGSDVHFYAEGRIGNYVPQPGHILGHEVAGEVVSIGENVKTRRVGDRIAVEPGVPCRRCDLCKEGRYNLCRDMIFRSHPVPFPLSEGAFTEYLVSPSDFTYPVADNVSMEEAALIEPLAVAMQAIKRGNLRAGQSVAILGSGPIGLSILQAANAAGARKIICIDLEQYRLDLAKELGAWVTVNASKENVVEAVMDLTGSQGVEVVFEAAGSPKAYLASTAIAARGGTVVFVGMAAETTFPMCVDDIIGKELDIISVWRYCNVYPTAIALVETEKVDMKRLITHRFPLGKITEAMDTAHERRGNAIKVVVDFTM